jgi:pyridoxine 5-phosphate synthase
MAPMALRRQEGWPLWSNQHKAGSVVFKNTKTNLQGRDTPSKSRYPRTFKFRPSKESFFMTSLSVNVNKLATLRNSRGKNNPDVVKGALDIIRFGGEGITVHPRPDERHIRKSDVYELKSAIGSVELNIEGYPSEDFLRMVLEVKAAQCTLVPDPPHVITSNAGWKVSENESLLREVAQTLKAGGVRSSVFVDPETMKDDEYSLLKKAGVDRVELYTESYAENFATALESETLAKYKRAAALARDAGLGVNAGHDLSLTNLTRLVQEIPWIDEVSIGHALICDALYLGLETAVQKYLECIRKGADAARASDLR